VDGEGYGLGGKELEARREKGERVRMGLMEGDGEEYDYTTSYGDEVSGMVEVYDTHYEFYGYGEGR
jgi:hypothetical protein